MREAINFVKNILQAKIIYEDPDFAAIEGFGSQWCFHTHHTYDSHPFKTITESSIYKGLGIELRLIGCDPDQAEIRAKEKEKGQKKWTSIVTPMYLLFCLHFVQSC